MAHISRAASRLITPRPSRRVKPRAPRSQWKPRRIKVSFAVPLRVAAVRAVKRVCNQQAGIRPPVFIFSSICRMDETERSVSGQTIQKPPRRKRGGTNKLAFQNPDAASKLWLPSLQNFDFCPAGYQQQFLGSHQQRDSQVVASRLALVLLSQTLLVHGKKHIVQPT